MVSDDRGRTPLAVPFVLGNMYIEYVLLQYIHSPQSRLLTLLKRCGYETRYMLSLRVKVSSRGKQEGCVWY